MEIIAHRGGFLLKLIDHILVVIFCLDVDREHTGGFSDTDHFFTGHLPVDVSR